MELKISFGSKFVRFPFGHFLTISVLLVFLCPSCLQTYQHFKLNSLSHGEYSSPMFSHVFEETILEPQSKWSLKCVASGTPLPQITWTLDGQALHEHHRIRIGDYVTSDGLVNSFVNISSVRVEDGGLYACSASNGINSIQHQRRISVYGSPFVRPMTNMSVVSGHLLTLHCPYSGYPIESISWEKRGTRLPQNHRQVVFPNGTLTIVKAERASDEDVYRCTVINKEGKSSSNDVYVSVIVAPLISPLHVAPNLREGMRSMLTCSILEGDPPFRIKWLKDGQELDSYKAPDESEFHKMRTKGNIQISFANEFSSTLLFHKVSYEDNGNYTCLVSNNAASTNSTINMRVQVPPKWVYAPTDKDAILGQNVVIDCQATGYPPPRIWWEHAKSSSMSTSPTNYQPVISNSHIHALENGSLIIKEVTSKDQGYYLCQATNGVNSGISKVVKVIVHVPANFKSSFDTKNIKKGDNLEVVCEAAGEKPVAITWSRDRMHFDPLKEPRYHLVELDTDETTKNTLQIAKADRRDSALFTCSASNKYGKDEMNIQVIVQEPPDRPESVTVTQVESRSAIISWTPPYSGNIPILSYQVEFRARNTSSIISFNDLNEKAVEVAPGSLNTLVLRSLRPLTRYDVRVKCENSLGWSDYSEVIEFITLEEAPSGPPRDVNVYPLSSRSLQVNWKPPDLNEHNGVIKGYYIGYRLYGSSESYLFKTVESNSNIGPKSYANIMNAPPETVSIKIGNLKRASKYVIIVQAFNGKGPGPQSDSVIAETFANDPPASPIVRVLSSDLSSVQLEWSFDSSSSSPKVLPTSSLDKPDSEVVVTGYYLYYKHQNGLWEEKDIKEETFSYAFNNLQCGSYYQFYVIAYNNIGKGDPSNVVSAKTKGGPPIPGRQQAFVFVNSTSATLNLKEWKSDGCPITHYMIQYKAKFSTEWTLVSNNIPASQSTMELEDLLPATWYSLLVIANSEAGQTETEYLFSTLTSNGATISPMDLSRQSINYSTLNLMLPTTTAVIVLMVIFFVFCKKRSSTLEESHENVEHYSVREDRIYSESGIDTRLSNLDHRKESFMCNELSEVNPQKLYHPIPYASHQIDILKEQQQQQQQIEEQQMQSHRLPGSGLPYLDSRQNPPTLHQMNIEHTYDIPLPPKWV